MLTANGRTDKVQFWIKLEDRVNTLDMDQKKAFLHPQRKRSFSIPRLVTVFEKQQNVTQYMAGCVSDVPINNYFHASGARMSDKHHNSTISFGRKEEYDEQGVVTRPGVPISEVFETFVIDEGNNFRRYRYRRKKAQEQDPEDHIADSKELVYRNAVYDRDAVEEQEARARMNAIEMGMMVGTERTPREVPCVIRGSMLLKYEPTGEYLSKRPDGTTKV